MNKKMGGIMSDNIGGLMAVIFIIVVTACSPSRAESDGGSMNTTDPDIWDALHNYLIRSLK